MPGEDSFKPGLNVNIVVDQVVEKDKSDVRKSSIYDISGDRVIVAQTDPPITRTSLQKTMLITYLAMEKNKPSFFLLVQNHILF